MAPPARQTKSAAWALKTSMVGRTSGTVPRELYEGNATLEAVDEPRRTPLRTLLGDYPTTHALRQGTSTSPIAPLAFADVAVPNKAFKRVVRDLEFDVAEIALMTFLMARSRGVPLKLLPVVVFSRNPLPHLVCDRERGRCLPADLPVAESPSARIRPRRPCGFVRCWPISSASMPIGHNGSRSRKGTSPACRTRPTSVATRPAPT